MGSAGPRGLTDTQNRERSVNRPGHRMCGAQPEPLRRSHGFCPERSQARGGADRLSEVVPRKPGVPVPPQRDVSIPVLALDKQACGHEWIQDGKVIGALVLTSQHDALAAHTNGMDVRDGHHGSVVVGIDLALGRKALGVKHVQPDGGVGLDGPGLRGGLPFHLALHRRSA